MPLTLLCRNATALDGDGSIDEEALRQFLQHFDLKRFNQYVKRWRGAHPRWIKMMMKAFGMPGSALRGPYLMPDDAEIKRFTAGLLKLNIAEIDELARASGMMGRASN